MITPVDNNVSSWADQTSLLLAPFGIIGRLDDPLQWKAWAREANDVAAVRALLPPDPDDFADWQDWADRFNQVAGDLGV